MEGVVKRLSSTSLLWLIVMLLPVLFLVACERPLQEEREATPTADMTQPTVVPGGSATPSVSATVVPGYPAPGESAYPAPGEGEEPAGEGELPGEPAATASPEATAGPQEDVVHVVVAGDTVGALAERYGVTVEAIAAANNMTSIHTLDVGQELIIPLGGEDETAEEAPAATAEAEPEEQVHIVQAGDNLYRIGLLYGFTIEELTAYNNLVNPNDLEVGQQILIPPEGYTVPEN